MIDDKLTSPQLIEMPSRARSPVAPVRFRRSEPAKSTKLNLAVNISTSFSAVLPSTCPHSKHLLRISPAITGFALPAATSSLFHDTIAASSVVGHFPLSARWPETLCCLTISTTQRLVMTSLEQHWRHTFSPCVRTCSALEASCVIALYKCTVIYLLTYLLTLIPTVDLTPAWITHMRYRYRTAGRKEQYFQQNPPNVTLFFNHSLVTSKDICTKLGRRIEIGIWRLLWLKIQLLAKFKMAAAHKQVYLGQFFTDYHTACIYGKYISTLMPKSQVHLLNRYSRPWTQLPNSYSHN